MPKEYTKIRQLYAWIGFITLVAVAVVGLIYAIKYCIRLDQTDKAQLQELINNNLA